MIEARHLVKRFGDTDAVRDVSFTAERGGITGILGPNGAGKTTTIRMLVTALAPDAGSVCVAGYDVVGNADQVRRHIGYLPESPALYNEMMVGEYLSFFARLHEVPGRFVQTRVAEATEQCGLEQVSRKLCGHLSRGYRQRVGLARAMVHHPAVLILDEPTSGLDPAQIVEIRNVIAAYAENHTVLLSTHILQEVEALCQQVVVISEGRTVIDESIGDVRKRGRLEKVFLDCISSKPLTDSSSSRVANL